VGGDYAQAICFRLNSRNSTNRLTATEKGPFVNPFLVVAVWARYLSAL